MENSLQMKLHLLSITFFIIEQYPKESEENSFINQSLQVITSDLFLEKENSIEVLFSKKKIN